MRILIFGASGQTGQQVVQQAVERQHVVTAYTRNASKWPAVSPTVRLVEGTLADYPAISAAVSGHDAVVSTLGVGTPLEHDAAVIEGVRSIVRAMDERGVRRLIYQSFIGVAASRNAVGFVLRYIAPIPLRHEIADHEAKEAIVMGSALEWTVVRPPKLTNGPRTGRFRSGTDISTWAPVPLLSRADVACFILDELATPRHVRKAARLLR